MHGAGGQAGTTAAQQTGLGLQQRMRGQQIGLGLQQTGGGQQILFGRQYIGLQQPCLGVHPQGLHAGAHTLIGRGQHIVRGAQTRLW